MKPTFAIEHFIRFYEFVRIGGILHIPGVRNKNLKVLRNGSLIAEAPITQATALGENTRFAIFFLCQECEKSELTLIFEAENGSAVQITGTEAARLHLQGETARNRCEARFFRTLQQPGFDRVLEVGSRARSNIIRKDLFKGKQYTGADVLNGPNVDVVADAHSLSDFFQPESFDALYSISTFEHLAMPWKVALEVNKVLRTGGLGYFVTHQTVGMHDLPWDFWRYSDTSWNSLFNEYTGFRVLETFLGEPMHLTPFIYHDHWKGHEGAAGFSLSSVLVQKTGPTTMAWDLDTTKVVAGVYPA